MADAKGRGIPRREIQGKPVDPSGVDRDSIGDDQRQPPGASGREGGAAGKFPRGSSSEGVGAGSPKGEAGGRR
jgi:hypothetical protein